MKKVFLIGWKDVTLAFRDRAALILMLLAPFALTLGLGFVTGRFSGQNTSGINSIQVALVNQDGAQMGAALVSVFKSKDLADLVAPIELSDAAQARRLVDEDKAAAAVIIPQGFTQSILPSSGPGDATKVVKIELYTNQLSPTGASVVRTIVDEYLNRLEVARAAGQVTVTQLVQNGLVQPQEAAKIGAKIGSRQGSAAANAASITVKNVTSQGQAVKFDVLMLLAPGMALMFLMYTVANGGRVLLAEKTMGTLPRLLVSPTSSAQVLGGKVFGIYLTGFAQMMILIVGTSLLFNLEWGDPLAVLALVLAAVAGACGWGLLITAVAKTPGQVTAVGSAVMLLFGILGGTFINFEIMPAWFRIASRITPNAWGVDGFTILAMGGSLADVLQPVIALLAMGALLFVVSVVLINRRGLAG